MLQRIRICTVNETAPWSIRPKRLGLGRIVRIGGGSLIAAFFIGGRAKDLEHPRVAALMRPSLSRIAFETRKAGLVAQSAKTAKRREALAGALFLLPGVGIIFTFVLFPALLAFLLSFTHCTRFGTITWAGLYNYRKLATDPIALRSFLNTLQYVIVFVPANLVLALTIAVLLNRQFRGMRIIRSVYFVPVVVSGVVAVSIFRFLYDHDYGPINSLLATLGFEPIPWLWDKRWAMWAIIGMSLWKSSAFFSIILLAALQDVPRELHEAAMVDGAGAAARFRHVTIPCLRPVMIAVLALSSIGAFRVFIPMFVLTEGGPAYSTRTIALHAYLAGFRDGRLGYSSAISFALLLIILCATVLLQWSRRRAE